MSDAGDARAPSQGQTLQRWIPLALLCLAAYLVLTGLDNSYFWDDEAQVGIMANNLLGQGSFTGWDGRNLYTYHNGRFLDDAFNFTPVMPPLMFLVAAGSFELLGASTFAGRLPFALAGLAALCLYWRVTKIEFRAHPTWGLTALGLMTLSVTYLLNARQCRYYTLALLFGLAVHYFYLRFRERPQWRFALLLAASGILLFYSTYLLCAAFLLVLGVYHLLFHFREMRRAEWNMLLAAVAVFLLATLPYALYHQLWISPDLPPEDPWYWRKPTLTGWNLLNLNLTAMLPWVAALGLVPIAWMLRRHDPEGYAMLRRWSFLALGNAVALGLFSPEALASPDITGTRYLLLSLPGCCAMLSVFVGAVATRSAVIAALAFVVLTCTNLATLGPPDSRFRLLLPAYLAEIHSHTMTPEEAVTRYLAQHARQDDLVMTVPDHFVYTQIFYLGDRIRVCCALMPDTPLSRDLVHRVHAPAFADENFPHWIIVHGQNPGGIRALQYFSRPREEAGRIARYEYEPVAHLKVYPDSTQRPELTWHEFGTVNQFDQARDGVLVFRRKDPG